MKFKKNKISINESESNALFKILVIGLGFILLPLSISIQIIFLVLKQYAALVLIDCLLIFGLLIVVLVFFFKCSGSKVIINDDNIICQELFLLKRTININEIKEMKAKKYSKNNQLLSELWGKCIFLYDDENNELLRFSYNEVAYKLLLNKLSKQKTSIEDASSVKDTNE